MTHDSVRQGFARLISHILQTASASLGALIAISVWGVSGLFLRFSDTWQRVIATGTAT
jgi:low affinity Fe/Cu permease